MSMLTKPAICIACVGNELARDDGVGMRIGRILAQVPLPAGVFVRFYPQVDLDLIDDLLSCRRLLLCDATRTGIAPGTVTVHSWQNLTSLSRQPYCCHGIGLADLVKIAVELAPSTAQWDIHFVGVEAETVDEYGTQLSDAVQAALPVAISTILRMVSASAELIASAQVVARNFLAPNSLSAYGG